MRLTAMSFARSMSLAAFVAVLSSGCGDSSTEPDGVTLNDLVGSWRASSVLFTNNANAAQQFDIVAAGGDVSVTVLTQGRVRTWLTLGDFSDEWDAQLSLSGNQLTSTPVEASRPTRHYTLTLQGDQFTMTSNDARFDFTLSGGTEVPASEVVVFNRKN